MNLYGDVHVKASFPVKAGESILGSAPLIADADGYASSYVAGEGTFIGHAVLPVNNTNGADGEKTVAVAIDGLVVGDVVDLTGAVGVGDLAIHLDANRRPVIDPTDARVVGKIVSLLGGTRVVWRTNFGAV